MWLARPVYESLPYAYMVIGIALIAAAWWVDAKALPSVLMVAGGLSVIGGLVLWMHRRDYRQKQAEYNSHSLDE
ncbi:MAG TPA: hypothetical protein VFS47_12305 [Steroidobacteraceae bacterium]|jgi:hypothetical protein|nr:hypothetical protein [Steroidobacteraceae bacterium]